MKRRRTDVKQIPPEERKRREEERAANFRAWWESLTPEQRHSEIRAGHVRLKLGHVPEKARKPKKRTRAAQARSAEVEAMRAANGEAFVHATPLQRFGVGLRAAIAARDAAA